VIVVTVDAFVLVMFGNDRVRVYDASLFEWVAKHTLTMRNPVAAASQDCARRERHFEV